MPAMVAKNLLDDVLALPAADRMELYDRLGESLRNDPACFPISEEDKRILDERLADYEANPDEGSSWEEVEARILQNLKGES